MAGWCRCSARSSGPPRFKSCCLTRFLHANRYPLRLKTLYRVAQKRIFVDRELAEQSRERFSVGRTHNDVRCGHRAMQGLEKVGRLGERKHLSQDLARFIDLVP